jgi:hypothetical protein
MVEERDRDSVTKVEVLTVDHHLLGYVATTGRRFSTWLNMGDSPTLTLDKVALRSLHDVGKSDVPLEYVLVNRDAIMAVIPREAPVAALGRDQDQRPLEYVEKEPHAVVISLPPFAIRGEMHLARSADLQRALISFPGDFMPITEARIVYTPNPELLWQGSVILVNRDKAQLYWPAPQERSK